MDSNHEKPARGSVERAASWNPALRDEKDLHPAPAAKTPAPPKPDVSSEEEESEEDEDDEEEESEEDEDEDEQTPAIAAVPASAPKAVGVAKPSLSTPGLLRHQAHQSKASSAEDDALVNATQTLSIAERPAAAPAKDASSDEESEEESEEEESSEEEASAADAHQADNYEHQGEATALEEAVNESMHIPLVKDAAPETDEWGVTDDAFELGGQQQDALAQTPQTEAVGTTVGDDVIGNTTVGGNAGDELDWGSTAEEEDFFGGNASNVVEPAQPGDAAQTPGAHVVQGTQAEPAGNDWDLDLDLDEDFLPDSEDGPVIQLSDDEGFLDDEPPAATQPATNTVSGANRYAPQASQTSTPAASPFATQTQFANAPQGSLATSTTSPTVAYNGYGQNVAYLQQQQAARPALSSSAQSYADKSKGGYASPYDMPDDIVTTRKRTAPRTSLPAAQPTAPPPRTSSMSSSSGPPRPLPSSSMSAASLSPPSSSHSTLGQMTGFPPVAPPKPAPPAKAASSDFFAELPVTSKPKPPGRYTPQPAASAQSPSLPGPPQFPPKERTASWSSLRNEVLPESVGTQPHFRQPEQLPMFPSQPSVPARQDSLPLPQSTAPPPSSRYSPAPPSAPTGNARYSPAPPVAQAGANSRYSPAPPGAQGVAHARYASEPPTGPARPPSQTYAPRTSSPLAFHTMPQQHDNSTTLPEPQHQQVPGHQVSQSADGLSRPPFRSPLEEVSEALESDSEMNGRPPMTSRSGTPPRSGPSSTVGSPRKRGTYTPQYQSTNPSVPSRSLSQSPAASMKQSAPAYGAAPFAASYAPPVQDSTTTNHIPHRRQASLVYETIAPEDERAADPLQRWRGHPVFAWGLGGNIVTSFPKQIPRYGGGMTAPMMKCSPGEVKIQSIKETLPLTEDIAKFPGPLKAKSKKKDVSAWLARKIEALDGQIKDPNSEHSLTSEQLKRLEEKALLYRLLQFLVDNDGRLEGEAVNGVFRKLFSPEGEDATEAEGSFSTAADIVGRSRSNTANVAAEPIDARAVEDLQKLLAKGEREKAVWHAVDQRLWGHAMLLSSTLSKDVWKQVVQEFVRKEVKKVGRSNQALAVLYEVFAGNHEDCIDELVPASARAGFQMVSTDGAGAAQNAQQGLDKWRETIALILNNRSDGDASALLSLGRLLSQYGRIEAAHICFILGRAVAHVSGVDDVQADLVLVGMDHKQYATEVGIDLEPILLTEVYEFALSLSAPNNTHIMPHLQNYKLAHAYQLAENGYRTDAQAYCDAIAAAMKASTRLSPYYNASFIASLDDLGKRLSQSPKDNSSSWISKPSMDRVSTSLLSKFNSFIAGDDENPAANGAIGTEAGPFANIPGNSPSITPSQSNADLYGAYSGYGAPAQQAASTNSRYAPSNAYAPRTSSEQQRSRYDPQGRPSMESIDSPRAMSDSYMPMTPMTPAAGPYSPQPQLSPPSQRTQAKTQSYSPLRAEHNVSQPSYGSPYMPTPPLEESSASPAFGGYQPDQSQPSHSFDDNVQPTSSFDGPSYQPYNPDEDDKDDDTKPKKKSIMDDDDDDLVARASALKLTSSSTSKSDADRKADEAFRAAAEADAKRDAAAKKSGGGGWLSGWFKKDPNAAPGPIKAKLGEESSFYYDPDLGKWVNKKGGASEPERATATPPPPKGPPMGGARSASGGMPPPSGPPMGLMKPPTSAPQRSSSMPPPMAVPGSRSSTPGLPSDTEGGPKPPTLARPSFGAASGPPSRPGTGMSNASSIDDLLGAPAARKGAKGGKKKGGRYVDVFPQGS